MLKLYPTTHSVQRAKERVGWNRQILERMLVRIYYDGLFTDVCRGRLRDYLESCRTEMSARFACVYGEHVYIFGRGEDPGEMSLITILNLPLDLRVSAHKAKARYTHQVAA